MTTGRREAEMRMLGLGVGAVAAALLGAACGSSVAPPHADEGMLIPACEWPPAAETFDAVTSSGCQPQSIFQICEVPSGSYVHADGTVTTPEGTTVKCESACKVTEYTLRCTAPPSDPPVFPSVPDPPPSFGCQPVPIPTPPGLVFYCCACGAGG